MASSQCHHIITSPAIASKRRRFDLESNKACAKYHREVNKSEKNRGAWGMCVQRLAQIKIYTHKSNLAGEEDFWELKKQNKTKNGREQIKVSRNTRGASTLQWKSHKRHLFFRITSSPKPGPSVLCQQPGTEAKLYRGSQRVGEGVEVGKGRARAGVSERNGRRIETDRANTRPD